MASRHHTSDWRNLLPNREGKHTERVTLQWLNRILKQPSSSEEESDMERAAYTDVVEWSTFILVQFDGSLARHFQTPANLLPVELPRAEDASVI